MSAEPAYLGDSSDCLTPAEIQFREAFASRLRGDDEGELWARERARCKRDRAYFIDTYVQIFDNESQEWVPFSLWDAQREALALLFAHPRVAILKSRQVGLSWLCLAGILHETQFNPIGVANVFSLRENEAVYLLGDERLRGMWERLPVELRSGITTDSARHIGFANGSQVRAFPTSAGDSYAATLALVDEADLVPDLKKLVGRVKPSIDAGGRIWLISRADKDQPQSEFKNIYRAAREGRSSWKALFLPWNVRPGRTLEWYAQECRDAMENQGALDEVHQSYPATDAEALAPRTLSKRYPSAWLLQCYEKGVALDLSRVPGSPALPELVVYALPDPKRKYVMGVDPAEGIPGGDASSAHVLDRETGEEVAKLAGLLEPKRAFPEALAMLATWYNGADVLVERNNHGHAVIAGLEAKGMLPLLGRDEKPGWVESTLGKAILCDTAADAFKNGETRIRSFTTYTELSSIDRNTLSAPKGQHDDEAVSFGLALIARSLPPRTPPVFGVFTL